MIIGIAGPSNAGKSALAQAVKRELEPGPAVILCQDDYVFQEDQLPRIRERIDWELPRTIDFNRLQSDILKAEQNFNLVIVEGFLLFWNKELNQLFQRMIFVKITEETFRRRKARDMRWGNEPSWYVDHIWQCFLQYGQPPEGHDLLVVHGNEPWPIQKILDFINN